MSSHIPEHHITKSGAAWVTPWHEMYSESGRALDDREDRYVLMWTRPRFASPHTRHVAVMRDGDEWCAIAYGLGWRSARCETIDEAKAAVEVMILELVY